MKTKLFVIIPGCSLLFGACDKEKTEKPPETNAVTALAEEFRKTDIPILPIEKGDFWKYKVSIEIPPGVTSEGAAAVDFETEKTRTFIGEIKISEERPPVETFEVVVPGQPVERELVEIQQDRIMMIGTVRPEAEDTKPIWLDPPIPFVIAGMRPGQEMVPFTILEGTVKRGLKVVAREEIEVPAGKYRSIRMLMTGNDGQFELRRTTWFAPGVGIVKEEKNRYAGEKLLFREITELVETNVKKK